MCVDALCDRSFPGTEKVALNHPMCTDAWCARNVPSAEEVVLDTVETLWCLHSFLLTQLCQVLWEGCRVSELLSWIGEVKINM